MDNALEVKHTKDEQTVGYLLRIFKKLVPNHRDADNKQFDYLIWSTFDGLNFKKVSCLNDFYSESHENSDEIDPHSLYDEQRMCLYSKKSENSRVLEPDYKIDIKGRLFNAPLIVLTEIKLNDRRIAADGLDECENRINSIIRKYKSSYERAGAPESIFDYELFRSLGYGDIVVVFRSRSYNVISNIVEMLKNPRSEFCSKTEAMPEDNPCNCMRLIWSTYSILGISRDTQNWGDDWDDLLFKKVSMRLSLNTSSGVDILKREIFNKLKGSNKKYGQDYKVQYDISFQIVSGKYDVEIVIIPRDKVNAGIRRIVELFYTSLDPNSKFYRKNILSTNTGWTFDSINAQEKSVFKPGECRCVNKHPDAKTIIKRFHAIFEEIKDSVPESLEKPMQQLLFSFERLIMQASAYPVFHELSKIFETLFYVLLESLGYPDGTILHKLGINEGKDKKASPVYHFPKDRVIEISSLKLSIKCISDLINDGLQASRPFFENIVHNIKFSGSITKLIMAYSTLSGIIEQEMHRNYSNVPKDSPSSAGEILSHITFFLTLDISNEIHSHLLFDKSSEHPERRLVSISCDTTTIFRTHNAICFLMHEIGHYIKPTDRAKRNELYINIICNFISEFLIHEMFRENEKYKKEYMDLFGDMFTEIHKEIKKGLYRIVCSDFKGREAHLLLPLENFSELLKTHIFSTITKGFKGKLKEEQCKVLLEEWEGTLDTIADSAQLLFSRIKKVTNGAALTPEEKKDKVYKALLNMKSHQIQSLVSYLASCCIHEKTVRNKKDFLRKMIDIFSNYEFQDLIIMNMDCAKTLLKEITADAFMCTILDMKGDEYRYLMSGYFTRAQNMDIDDYARLFEKELDDISIKNYRIFEKKEYLVRSLIIGKLWNSHNPVNEENGEEPEEINLLKNILNVLRFFSYKDIIEYIRKEKKDYEAMIFSGDRSSGLKDIRLIFRKLANLAEDKGKSSIGQEADFVEQYWHKCLEEMYR